MGRTVTRASPTARRVKVLATPCRSRPGSRTVTFSRSYRPFKAGSRRRHRSVDRSCSTSRSRERRSKDRAGSPVVGEQRAHQYLGLRQSPRHPRSDASMAARTASRISTCSTRTVNVSAERSCATAQLLCEYSKGPSMGIPAAFTVTDARCACSARPVDMGAVPDTDDDHSVLVLVDTENDPVVASASCAIAVHSPRSGLLSRCGSPASGAVMNSTIAAAILPDSRRRSRRADPAASTRYG